MDLELTRAADDRRLYALAGVGTLRLEGFAGRSATAGANGQAWRLARRGVWRRQIEAIDAQGAVVGEFTPRAIRRGGDLNWRGRELSLRPASVLRERYALADGERELAVFDGKGWGRRPVRITVADSESIEPALLLFAAFVVRGLAEDAGAAGSSAATGTYG